MPFTDYEEFKNAIREAQGVLTVSQADLTTLEGKKNSGKWVRKSIQDHLRNRGIHHFPDPLPNHGRKFVRVYDPKSPAGRVIAAVLNLDPSADDVIRGCGSTNDVTKTLVEEISEVIKKFPINGRSTALGKRGLTGDIALQIQDRRSGAIERPSITEDYTLQNGKRVKGPNEIRLGDQYGINTVRITRKMAATLGFKGNREAQCGQFLGMLQRDEIERTATGWNRKMR